ncbi:MAG: SDR family NAD(P)-dependent oxidoreductase [Polyangiaceae bacterium]
MRRLQDRVAVVTGAASGIGRATSIELAREGCHLALADIDEKGLDETRREVESLGRRASTHIVDVASRSRVAELVDEVVDVHQRVNIVINNAGVGVGEDIENHNLDNFEWLFGINFWGVVYGSKFFLPVLKREDEAHIVNISSMFGFIGLPRQAAYCASKFAVRGFTESLAAELTGTSVGVTCVHPGGINTNIARSARVDNESLKQKAVDFFSAKTLPASHCAKKIVHGIKHNEARVLVAPEAYLTDVMKRAFPVLTNGIAVSIFKRLKLG